MKKLMDVSICYFNGKCHHGETRPETCKPSIPHTWPMLPLPTQHLQPYELLKFTDFTPIII